MSSQPAALSSSAHATVSSESFDDAFFNTIYLPAKEGSTNSRPPLTQARLYWTLVWMENRERLKSLLVERSLFLGEFTLSSGARSTYYVDARRTTLSAEGQFLVGRVCLDALLESGWEVTHVGGLTMGADPVAYAIAHASWELGQPLDAFTVRKAAKSHGRGQRIEGGLPEGARCLVVEDSMTSGASALEAVSALREEGFQVAGVLTLVDREEGGRLRVEQAGLPFRAVFTAAELLDAEVQSSSLSGITKHK